MKKIIAIDPDVDKSGVGVIEITNEKPIFTIYNKKFVDLCLFVRGEREKAVEDKYELRVIIEAGWLNKISNFHSDKSKSTYSQKEVRINEHIAKSVGNNHEVGKILNEALTYILRDTPFVVELVYPLQKCWNGPKGKITHEELANLLDCSGLVGIFKQSNPDARDALLLALHHSNIPMRTRKL